MKIVLLVSCLFLIGCAQTVVQELDEGFSVDVIEPLPIEDIAPSIEVQEEAEPVVETDEIIEVVEIIQPEVPADTCLLFDDFVEGSVQDWFIVNDNVMGGRSLGGAKIEDGNMIFTGSTNTNGGGFASIRVGIPSGLLEKYTYILVNGISDGRGYDITFRDGRQWRITHRAPLILNENTQQILFTDLTSAYFGRPVQADAFQKNVAREMGIIINDGLDGPFELVIDSISFCRSTETITQ